MVTIVVHSACQWLAQRVTSAIGTAYRIHAGAVIVRGITACLPIMPVAGASTYEASKNLSVAHPHGAWHPGSTARHGVPPFPENGAQPVRHHLPANAVLQLYCDGRLGFGDWDRCAWSWETPWMAMPLKHGSTHRATIIKPACGGR